jgi:PncC family amidohydrolase
MGVIADYDVSLMFTKDESNNMASAVIKLFVNNRYTLAVAESVSGGHLSACLSSIPGASEVFVGGAIVYSVLAKVLLAGLDPAFIAMHGTVSESVTSQLALAIRRNLCTDWSLAITGNAGPTSDKGSVAPIGVCFIAVAGPYGVECVTAQFDGSRIDIQISSVSFALDMLRRRVLTYIAIHILKD